MNSHVISGRLTRDPEMVGQSANVAKFTVAVDEWDSQAQEKVAEFFDCVAFKNQAETAQKYLTKGRYVVLRGKMRSRKYESKKHPGVEIKAWEFIVNELELGPRSGNSATDDSSAEEITSAPVKLW